MGFSIEAVNNLTPKLRKQPGSEKHSSHAKEIIIIISNISSLCLWRDNHKS